MFGFIFKKINKKTTRDNSCNVTFSQLINNNSKKSIIIYDNSANINFINKTPIPSLDLENPTHFKIFNLLNELERGECKNKIYDNLSDDKCDLFSNQLLIQNNIKNENIRRFISCFDINQTEN